MNRPYMLSPKLHSTLIHVYRIPLTLVSRNGQDSGLWLGLSERIGVVCVLELKVFGMSQRKPFMPPCQLNVLRKFLCFGACWKSLRDGDTTA